MEVYKVSLKARLTVYSVESKIQKQREAFSHICQELLKRNNLGDWSARTVSLLRKHQKVSKRLLYLYNSDFGQQFRAAAGKATAKTRHDGFETAMIEVKNEDWRPFIENLSNPE